MSCAITIFVLEKITIPLKKYFPNKVWTLGDLASDVFRLNLKELPERLGGINAQEIKETIKETIVYQLGVKPEAVVPEARFVEDFGVQ